MEAKQARANLCAGRDGPQGTNSAAPTISLHDLINTASDRASSNTIEPIFMGAVTRTRLFSQNKSVLEADIVKRSLPYNVVSGDCGITGLSKRIVFAPKHMLVLAMPRHQTGSTIAPCRSCCRIMSRNRFC